ncbi:hypothetical protein BEI_2767 [Halomonas beimenensis]|uniref:Uncharacterized protein n=1 Tax=Halomonas beimenensis TaxID=475662 RepID=A0A291PA46_9GAMM|nr:hypothetical protein BEI_2767 [Halomonas beimenensis]
MGLRQASRRDVAGAPEGVAGEVERPQKNRATPGYRSLPRLGTG